MDLSAILDNPFEGAQVKRHFAPADAYDFQLEKTGDMRVLLLSLIHISPDLDGQLALAEPLAAAGIPAAWFKVESFSDYLSICLLYTSRCV